MLVEMIIVEISSSSGYDVPGGEAAGAQGPRGS